MGKVSVENLADIGVISDINGYNERPNAFTVANNIDYHDGSAHKSKGATELDASLILRPEWLLPYLDPESGTYYWIYPGIDDSGNGKIATWDGTTHTEVTRAVGGNYTQIAGVPWTGGVLNGLPIINSGADTPQKWDRTAGVLKADMEDLANWPAAWTARLLRPFKNFLVAFDINDTGASPTRNPFRLAWSDAAEPFTEPASWTATPSNLAGDLTLSEDGGNILEAQALRGDLIIYRQYKTEIMRFVGGSDIMDVKGLFSEFGALATRCVKPFGDGMHFVAAAGDFYIHNGSTVQNIGHRKVKHAVFDEIDPDNYVNSFVVPFYKGEEMWFCYPTTGNTIPNKVAKWNIRTGAWSYQLLTGMAHIGYGVIPQVAVADDWDTDSGTWDSDTSSWDDGNANPSVQDLIIGRRDVSSDLLANAKFLLGANGNQQDGSDMVVRLERTGLSLYDNNGQMVNDESIYKEISEIWPEAKNGPFDVSVGTASKPNGPYTWDGPYSFDPSTDDKVDVRVEGRYWGVRFESNANVAWELDSYDVIMTAGGDR